MNWSEINLPRMLYPNTKDMVCAVNDAVAFGLWCEALVIEMSQEKWDAIRDECVACGVRWYPEVGLATAPLKLRDGRDVKAVLYGLPVVVGDVDGYSVYELPGLRLVPR